MSEVSRVRTSALAYNNACPYQLVLHPFVINFKKIKIKKNLKRTSNEKMLRAHLLQIEINVILT